MQLFGAHQGRETTSHIIQDRRDATLGFSYTRPLCSFLIFPGTGLGIRIFDSRQMRELIPGEDFSVEASPLILGRTRLLVQWLKPLAESTQYLVTLTPALRAPDGAPGIVNEVFAMLRNPTPVSQQQNSILAALASVGRQADIGKLESLQTNLVQPVIDGVSALSAAVPNSRGAISRDEMLLAWSFTTQSITPTLTRLADKASAQLIAVQDAGLDLSQAIAPDPGMPVPVPADADVYAGLLELPYYLGASDAEINTSFWLNDGMVSDATHPALGRACNMLRRP